MSPDGRNGRILVTGATGYVGGRLVPRLLEEGYDVRCMSRDASRLEWRPWRARVEVVEADVLAPASLEGAFEGVSCAYYLVHSMYGGPDYRERDRRAAAAFVEEARRAGVDRIVYLGGLGDPGADLSEHLRSRHEVGEVLRRGGVPVTELRAAIVVGSGSASFEMIRYLVERIPVMVCPRWVRVRVQPIGIEDLLAYLTAVPGTAASADRVIEIGGEDVLTYGEMLKGYARVRGLPRLLVPVPVLTPRLSSYWVHLVTPLPSGIARPLIEGLRNETIVRDRSAAELFPEIEPMGYETAVRLALRKLEAGEAETAWSDALASSQGDRPPVTLVEREGMIVERRTRVVDATPQSLFRAFTGLGGDTGWLYANPLWRLRGILDRLAGGVGLRRGRRHPSEVREGDALDFWRVERVEPDRRLLLRAEMKVPGRAWLQFETRPRPDGRSDLEQTAYFAPHGLWGFLYWYALYPLHAAIFRGLIERLAERSRDLRPETG